MWSKALQAGMLNYGFSRFNKAQTNPIRIRIQIRILCMFTLLWFYCTLDCTTSAIESKDFKAFNNLNGSSTSRVTDFHSNVPHSRRKRFLAFPLGSSFSTAICLTTGVIGNPNYQFLSMGLNWGLAYELPNATWVLEHTKHGNFKRKNGDSGGDTTGGESGDSTDGPMAGDMADMSTDMNKTDEKAIKAADAEAEKNIKMVQLPFVQRRERRELYGKVEKLIDSMGYNGRDCILRALCESRQYFRKNKLSMVGEMLRSIFSLPKQRLFTRELRENSEIKLYDHAYRRTRDVDCSEQYDCTFSLLELAFGKYSTPPPNYYK